MEIIRTKNQIPEKIKNVVLTLGNFDGVHKGHQKLLSLTRDNAKQNDGKSVVLTFDPHPVKLFKPSSFTLIQPLTEKLARLEKAGIDICVVMEFSRDLADHSAKKFIEGCLLEMFDLKHVIIGYDTTFGKRRQGTPEVMKEFGARLGFKTTVVDAVIVDKKPVSSSRIRKTVARGNIRDANNLLGYQFKLSGTVVKGYGRGSRLLGYPTANIQCNYDLFPAKGVYAVWVNRASQNFRGALNIGTNPTFGNDRISVEVYILDFDEDIYGETISVKMVERLRSEKRFDSIDELKAQMALDVKEVVNVLR